VTRLSPFGAVIEIMGRLS